MAGKLANMHTMLSLDAWRKWPLSVKIFSEDVWIAWERCTKKKGVDPLPPWITSDLDLKQDISSHVTETSAKEINTTIDNQFPSSPAKKPRKSTKAIKKSLDPDKSLGIRPTTGGVASLDLLDSKAQISPEAEI